MNDIKDIFRAFGHELGQALGESMLEAVRAELPRLRAELGVPLDSPRTGSTRGAKVSQALTRHCPVDGCTRQGRGPRYSFLCELHRDLPAEERDKYRVRTKR